MTCFRKAILGSVGRIPACNTFQRLVLTKSRFSFAKATMRIRNTLLLTTMASVSAFTVVRPNATPLSNQHQQTRLFMNVLQDLFAAPQLDKPDEIKAAFNQQAIVIDVRSPGEITTKVDAGSTRWINVPATPFDCPDLAQNAASLVGKDKSKPVILYCASGKRASKAASILKDQGYEHVYNAGGIGQITYLPIENVK